MRAMRRHTGVLFWLFAHGFVLIFSVSLNAQLASSTSPPTYVVSRIASTGSKLFSDTDIAAVSGLKPGSRISAADLQHANDRLAQTGAFSQVNFRFDGVVATFIVVDADADQFVPATFENFVWFTDADLVKRIHSVVPLFSGNLPLSGNLSESVSGALESILRDRGIPGHVVGEASPASGQVNSIQFRIEGLKATIAGIEFPGASPPQLVTLQQAVKDLLGRPYMESETLPATRRVAQIFYGKTGYLKAKFGPAKVSVITDDLTAPAIGVELPVIDEGPQFTVSGVDCRGNVAISTAELMKAISCKVGTVADTSCLGAALTEAQLLYGKQGFMAARVKTTATIDNETHTATFHLNIEEGPVYHFAKLEVLDLPDQQAQIVRRIWKMHEGDVYDASYVKDFLKSNVERNPSLGGWEGRYVQTIHDDTQLVDLSMKFQKMQ